MNTKGGEVGVKSLSLSPNQISALEKTAQDDGDSDAALRLAKHYIFFKNEELAGVRWLRVAASSGNSQAIEILTEMGYR